MPTINGYYDPQLALNMEAQTGGLDVQGAPGSQFNLGGLLGGLDKHLANSLALKQRAALQQMALADRRQGLAEAEFGAGRRDAAQALRFQRANHQMGMQDRRRQIEQADLAQVEAQRLRGQQSPMRGYEATFAQQVGGPNQVSGLVAASGETPGAVMTGYRRGPSTLSSAQFVNGGQSHGMPAVESFQDPTAQGNRLASLQSQSLAQSNRRRFA